MVENNKKYYTLTHGEMRIHLSQKMHPGESLWNVPSSVRIPLADIPALEKAIKFAAGREMTLRTRFTERDGRVRKYFASEAEDPPVEHVHLHGEQGFHDWVYDKAREPILHLDARLYRFVITEVGGGAAYLHFNCHHILMDGGATALLLERVFKAYESLSRGWAPEEPPCPDALPALQDEIFYLKSEQYAQDRDYWVEQFSDLPEPMDLAGRPVGDSLAIESLVTKFRPGPTLDLLDFCAQNKVSPFRVVLAALTVYLSRTLRRDDVTLGTATSNRHPKEMRNALGMFSSTMPMRIKVDGEDSFLDVLNNSTATLKNTIKHERYPFSDLMKELREQHGDTPELLNVCLVEFIKPELPQGMEMMANCHGASLFSLMIFVSYPRRGETNGAVELTVMYNSQLFPQWRIGQLTRHLEQAVVSALRAPETPIRRLELMPEDEHRRIVNQFNATDYPHPFETTVHQFFSRTAARHPGRIAVVYRERTITFSELERRSTLLGAKLRAMGATPNTPVALLADRSLDVIVAQMGVLKSGAGFMPIDAGYPAPRIKFMLEDAQAPIVVTQNRFIQELDFGETTVLNLDDPELFQGEAPPLPVVNTPADLCVLIYTSGSTGNPKGALLEHRSICNVILSTMEMCALTPEDNIAKHASFSFDGSMLEVFGALFSGAQLHVLPEEIQLSLSRMNDYFAENNVTWAFLTTQLGEQLMENFETPTLRTLVVGGEKLRSYTPRGYQLINIYGPTECSIYATCCAVDEQSENIPIGPPIPNVRVYIVDKYNNPQPAGLPGELCIAGVGTGRGYLNRPEKTAETFVKNPFEPGQTMYRTGDLACWTEDGDILHLGRMDRQVKLRGFRIELGEIENAMLALDGVSEAAVADFTDKRGGVTLCGYYVGAASLTPQDVLQELKASIPDFMVPAHMTHLESMPLNPNKKIDRRKLPKPEMTTPDQTFIPPENDLETTLAAAWADVLDLEQVSVEGDFFQLGGDSLKAVTLQLAVGKALNVDVQYKDIFDAPTPRALAEALESAGVPSGRPQASQQPDREKAPALHAATHISPAPAADYYPATVAQQQLYLLSQMKGIGTTYNVPFRVDLNGVLDRKRLAHALQVLVMRHESLRTRFEVRSEGCVQIVDEQARLKLEFMDAQGKSDADIDAIAQEFVREFDLARAPLMRVKLVARNRVRHSLFMDFHHIIFDGASTSIFFQELMTLYAEEALPPVELQFKDVAVWLAEHEQDICARHESWWLERFASPPTMELPTDYPRGAAQSFSGDLYRYVFTHEESAALMGLARTVNATLHNILLAALSVFVSRWSGAEDVILGTTLAGRNWDGAQDVVGMFAQTLPVRLAPAKDKPFHELVRETKESMVEARTHGDYPISRLYEKLGVNRGAGRHPLFDVNLVVQNLNIGHSLELLNTTAKISFIRGDKAKFDFCFVLYEEDGRVYLEVEYRNDLYERSTIGRMVGHYARILHAVAERPDVSVGAISMLNLEERGMLLQDFNPPPTPAPWWPTVCQAISRHALETPDNLAVAAEGRQLTYRELNTRANQLALAIQAAGGGPETIVPVLAERNVEAVVGLLAVLKSNAAYVGLDVNYPKDRVDFILKDTAPPCVVGRKKWLDKVDFAGPKIALDEDEPYPHWKEGDHEPDPKGGNTLAYVVFTSGSTGAPKGVMIEHHSFVNQLQFHSRHFELAPGVRCGAFTSMSFDIIGFELFGPLVAGAAVYIIPNDLRRSPMELNEYFTKHNITYTGLPTQFAEQFMRMVEKTPLKHMLVGGDRLSNYKLGGYRLVNEYGPSETTMASTSFEVTEQMKRPPIGAPIDNTRIYIMDQDGLLCPMGVPGEMCIAGEGVGRGYLNRPELTQQKFVPDPFFPQERMFKTGDKARWLPGGNLDFLGRLDFQVKIRGYRIEPGEIEQRLLELPELTEVVIVALSTSGAQSEKVLVAYYTASRSIDAAKLRAHLHETLPTYMTPSYFVHLEEMPLNPNGKVDRKKLPRPELAAAPGKTRAPRTSQEERIAAAWTKALGHERFDLHDSFFDVGGDSLNAIALLAELSETFSITASDVFTHTTVAEQAVHFTEVEQGKASRLLRLKELAAPPIDDPKLAPEQEAYSARMEKDESLRLGAAQAPEHILLTGGTGVLGLYLLKELLYLDVERITAIVRGENNEHAAQRLAAYYNDCFGRPLEGERRFAKLKVLAGDLSEERLGLEHETWRELCVSVDAVVNSAALTRHYGDWDLFFKSNVRSVQNLLTLLEQGGKKGVMHHISTTSVGTGSVVGRSQLLFTEFDLDVGQQTDNVYVRSKFEGEREIVAARRRGVRANVYRAGNITCDSQTGAFQRNIEDNGFYQLLRGYVNLGRTPDMFSEANMTFVDQAAKAIALLLQRPGLRDETFHISNPYSMDLSKALCADSMGLRMERTSFDAFVEFVAASADCVGVSKYIDRILLHQGWREWLAGESVTASKIEQSRTVRLLDRCGFAWKTPDSPMLGKIVNHALGDRIQQLKKTKPFARVSESSLLDLARRVEPSCYGREDMLQHEADRVRRMQVIVKGMTETYRSSGAGWIGVVRVSGPGECLGEEGLTQKGVALHSVEALSEVFTLSVETEELRKLVKKKPELGMALLEISCAKTDQAEKLFVLV